MKSNAKIYVAGHVGLVGSALVQKLKEHGHENILTKTFKELDLRNQQETLNFFEKEKPEYVFLAAAKVGGINANNTYKAEFIYDNLMIAANVIHASYKFGVKKLLNLGSSCIYPKHAPQPLKEEYLLTGPLEPTNEPYAIAKIAAIKLCKFYNEQYGTNFISVMPTNLYGPHDNFNLETAHVLPSLMRKFHLAKLLSKKDFVKIKEDIERYSFLKSQISLSDEKIIELLDSFGVTKSHVEIWGTGSPSREFLYIEDLADACISLMQHHALKTFVNIGTGKDLQITDLASLIAKIIGYEGKTYFNTEKPDGTPRKVLDLSKTKALGWHAKKTLELGIALTYSWYKKNAK
jgi:GDP-L-fucose synthase